ncbi:MAG: tetratricopeptide repeat protein [Deltaproteobacteria bacterium]|nr:tetratricopeptide repeat protein [Deltaproteobacteria bacterium]
MLIKQRRFEAALQILENALEVVGDEVDLLLSKAWCIYNLPGSNARLGEMLALVDRALALRPAHDHAHYLRGLILLRDKKEREALASFQKAVEINPKNLEALQEARLLQKQLSQQAEAQTKVKSPIGQWFERLLKKG